MSYFGLTWKNTIQGTSADNTWFRIHRGKTGPDDTWATTEAIRGNEQLVKWPASENPIRTERKRRDIKGPDALVSRMKDDRLLKMIDAEPSESGRAALFQQLYANAGKGVEDSINANIKRDFEEWILGKAPAIDYTKAGLWPEDMQEKPPWLKRGILSSHPSVIDYFDRRIDAKYGFVSDLVKMRERMQAAEPGVQPSLDDLWLYYKYVVLGLPLEAEVDYRISQNDARDPPRIPAPEATILDGAPVSAADADALFIDGAPPDDNVAAMVSPAHPSIGSRVASLIQPTLVPAPLPSFMRVDAAQAPPPTFVKRARHNPSVRAPTKTTAFQDELKEVVEERAEARMQLDEQISKLEEFETELATPAATNVLDLDTLHEIRAQIGSPPQSSRTVLQLQDAKDQMIKALQAQVEHQKDLRRSAIDLLGRKEEIATEADIVAEQERTRQLEQLAEQARARRGETVAERQRRQRAEHEARVAKKAAEEASKENIEKTAEKFALRAEFARVKPLVEATDALRIQAEHRANELSQQLSVTQQAEQMARAALTRSEAEYAKLLRSHGEAMQQLKQAQQKLQEAPRAADVGALQNQAAGLLHTTKEQQQQLIDLQIARAETEQQLRATQEKAQADRRELLMQVKQREQLLINEIERRNTIIGQIQLEAAGQMDAAARAQIAAQQQVEELSRALEQATIPALDYAARAAEAPTPAREQLPQIAAEPPLDLPVARVTDAPTAHVELLGAGPMSAQEGHATAGPMSAASAVPAPPRVGYFTSLADPTTLVNKNTPGAVEAFYRVINGEHVFTDDEGVPLAPVPPTSSVGDKPPVPQLAPDVKRKVHMQARAFDPQNPTGVGVNLAVQQLKVLAKDVATQGVDAATRRMRLEAFVGDLTQALHAFGIMEAGDENANFEFAKTLQSGIGTAITEVTKGLQKLTDQDTAAVLGQLVSTLQNIDMERSASRNARVRYAVPTVDHIRSVVEHLVAYIRSRV